MNSKWSYSPETKIWVVTSVTLTFDLWPWPFAWTLPWSNVITPEKFMMIRWCEHSQKGVTDGQTDRQTDGQTDRRTENTIHRAAWSQLKIVMERGMGTFIHLRGICHDVPIMFKFSHLAKWKKAPLKYLLNETNPSMFVINVAVKTYVLNVIPNVMHNTDDYTTEGVRIIYDW